MVDAKAMVFAEARQIDAVAMVGGNMTG